jgi:hypothetical protein
MYRDCAVFKAALRAHVAEIFVRDAVPRMKLIIRAQTQHYNFPISLTHISVAKFGWLCVAQARNDVLHPSSRVIAVAEFRFVARSVGAILGTRIPNA